MFSFALFVVVAILPGVYLYNFHYDFVSNNILLTYYILSSIFLFGKSCENYTFWKNLYGYKYYLLKTYSAKLIFHTLAIILLFFPFLSVSFNLIKIGDLLNSNLSIIAIITYYYLLLRFIKIDSLKQKINHAIYK